MTRTVEDIRRVVNRLGNLLIEKNERYGDSALDPIRLFSRSDALEQLKVRIDDKLSRVVRGKGLDDEDVLFDLIGYLVLLLVAMMRKNEG